jgi:hypothetical protein
MKSRATSRFWKCFDSLPLEIQDLAEKNYGLWQIDPKHSSLHYKRLQGEGNRFSIRVGIRYRAIGWELPDGGVEWVWIGTHAEYERLIG